MADQDDDEIPAVARPRPEEMTFDLERALGSVVNLHIEVEPDAYTAGTLGTKRRGHGAVISDKGLVLTIGYLVVEAERIWITTERGTAVQGHVLAYDQATGFGLVQPLGKLNVPPLPLGRSSELEEGAPLVVAGSRGLKTALSTRLADRRPFAGYWEYYLEQALFTTPAHPLWGGAACIDAHGRLVGIGSLLVQEAVQQSEPTAGNMIVPIDLLEESLQELLRFGRTQASNRPWLGLYAADLDEGIVVTGTAAKGPAAAAGLSEGDVVLEVNGEGVDDLGELWRKVWAQGPPGIEMTLTVARAGRPRGLLVRTVDRNDFLKRPRMH